MIALLSDIHNNIHALDAVLSDIPKTSKIWVLGDIVGGLAYPCEVFDRLLNLDSEVTCIMGNHEHYIIKEKAGKCPDWRKGTQWGTMIWTSDKLKPYHWDFLGSLNSDLYINSIDALLFHGTPDSISASIIGIDTANEVVSNRNEQLLIGAHTHHARIFHIGRQTVITNGSVGITLDGIPGVASYTVIDEEKNDLRNGGIVFRNVVYDVDNAINSMKKSDLPDVAPGITKAMILELSTGRHYCNSLVEFVISYTEKQLGYKPDTIPPDIWKEAELKWDCLEWLPGRMR